MASRPAVLALSALAFRSSTSLGPWVLGKPSGFSISLLTGELLEWLGRRDSKTMRLLIAHVQWSNASCAPFGRLV